MASYLPAIFQPSSPGVETKTSPLIPASFSSEDRKLEWEAHLVHPPMRFLNLGGLGMTGFSNKVFTIRMSKSAQHTTSGAGALNLATPVYPSSFLQYTQITGHFKQVRIRTVRMKMISNVNPNSSSSGSTSYAGGTLALSFLPRSASGASPTTTAADVVRSPGVKIYNPLTVTQPVVITYRFPKDTPWSDISSSSTGTDPIAGTYGYFGHSSIGSTLTASTAYTTYVVEALFQFRAIL